MFIDNEHTEIMNKDFLHKEMETNFDIKVKGKILLVFIV